MNQYRVTKYNPAFRDEQGRYLRDEWTDFSDIGCTFSGRVLTAEQYYEVERHYIEVCISAWEKQGCPQIFLKDIENNSLPFWIPQRIRGALWFPKVIKDEKHLSEIIKRILENRLWARLEGEQFFIHFGWDYYMYIGTLLKPNLMSELASEYDLYCEEMISPHHKEQQ